MAVDYEDSNILAEQEEEEEMIMIKRELVAVLTMKKLRQITQLIQNLEPIETTRMNIRYMKVLLFYSMKMRYVLIKKANITKSWRLLHCQSMVNLLSNGKLFSNFLMQNKY